MSGPPPSALVLLSDIHKCDPGQKVRFLGCVDEYQTRNATLRLKHNFPPGSTDKIAFVNIEHAIESVRHPTIEVGAWLNIIGYVGQRKEKGAFVQAITVWDAGNVDIDAYQKAVEARKAGSS